MAKQRLTDKTLASSVSVNDIVHIVKTGDTSQNPAGSSYKATISQVVSTFTATSVTALTFNNISYDLTLGLDDGSSFTDNLGILASDIKVTGGTYNSSTGEINFVNNSGGTFIVSGITFSDTFVTGGTYDTGTESITFNNNTGGTFVVSGISSTFTGNTSGTCITDLYLTNLYGCSPINIQNDTIINGGLTGTSGLFSSATDNVLNVVGSGNSTSNPLFKVEGSSGELFSITDTLEGSLFSVNDISGLPIIDVNSDSTIQMGSITAPSLFTTVLTTATGGTENIYSLPTSAYTGGFFDYTLVGNGGARAGVITSIWSGTTTQYQDVSTNDIGSSTSGVTFDVSVSGNDAILSVSAITGTYTIKTIVRSI